MAQELRFVLDSLQLSQYASRLAEYQINSIHDLRQCLTDTDGIAECIPNPVDRQRLSDWVQGGRATARSWVAGSVESIQFCTGGPREPTIDELFAMHDGGEGEGFEDLCNESKVQVYGHDVPPLPEPQDEFTSYGLCPEVLHNLDRARFRRPTPVQKYGMTSLTRRRDFVASAQTGVGKTTAFLIPIINALHIANIPTHPWHPRLIYLSPTRELAIQGYNECRKFSSGTRLKCGLMCGGQSSAAQSKRMEEGVDLLSATVGRLLDMTGRRLRLGGVRYVVLDEADRLLCESNQQTVLQVLQSCDLPKNPPPTVVLISATLPEDVVQIAGSLIQNEVFVRLGALGATNPNIRQEIQAVDIEERPAALLQRIEGEMAGFQVMVFTQTRRACDAATKILEDRGISVGSMHGTKSQGEREAAVRAFRSSGIHVLCCTDGIGRGLDFPNLHYVISYELPDLIYDYTHRVGRTGRAGRAGHSVAFYDSWRDARLAQPLVSCLHEHKQPIPAFLSQYPISTSQAPPGAAATATAPPPPPSPSVEERVDAQSGSSEPLLIFTPPGSVTEGW